MSECHKCGDEVSMPYECNLCGDEFCSKHRLPEKHDCPMLDRGGTQGDVVVEMENQRQKSNEGILDRVPALSSFWDRIDGQVNKTFGFIIVSVYLLQLLTIALFGESLHNTLFVLEPNNMTNVWTLVTSMFSHSPNSLFHIIGNGFILIFFGGMVERLIGSKHYAGLFIGAGLLAGLSQAILGLTIGDPTIGILGASGALLAVLGVLTVYKPDLTVYLYFFIPVPLWLITIGYAVLSVVGILAGGGLGGIAHGAHLVGLLVGAAYGYRTKDKHSLSGSTRIGGDINR